MSVHSVRHGSSGKTDMVLFHVTTDILKKSSFISNDKKVIMQRRNYGKNTSNCYDNTNWNSRSNFSFRKRHDTNTRLRRLDMPRLRRYRNKKSACFRRRFGGPDQIRTGVQAFAELCLATRPQDLFKGNQRYENRQSLSIPLHLLLAVPIQGCVKSKHCLRLGFNT
ncbi:MAG: hypothetical protein RL021_2154 [Bacteroidota bacterium]